MSKMIGRKTVRLHYHSVLAVLGQTDSALDEIAESKLLPSTRRFQADHEVLARVKHFANFFLRQVSALGPLAVISRCSLKTLLFLSHRVKIFPCAKARICLSAVNQVSYERLVYLNSVRLTIRPIFTDLIITTTCSFIRI